MSAKFNKKYLSLICINIYDKLYLIIINSMLFHAIDSANQSCDVEFGTKLKFNYK